MKLGSFIVLLILYANSVAQIRDIEGSWAGKFEGYNGYESSIILKVEKIRKNKIVASYHWVEYFNSIVGLEGSVFGDKIELKEIKMIQGLDFDLATTYKLEKKDDRTLEGSAWQDGKELGVVSFTKWEEMDEMRKKYFKEISKKGSEKFGEWYVKDSIDFDLNEFFKNYRKLNMDYDMTYESVMQWETISYGNETGKKFNTAVLGKYFERETWGSNEYLSGIQDTIYWKYDGAKDEVSWTHYEMPKGGNNRYIDLLGGQDKENFREARNAEFEDQNFLRLKFVDSLGKKIFYHY